MEFIEAPETAPVGERIGLEGLEMVDPITPAQVKKQKVWEEMVTKVRPCPQRAPHHRRVAVRVVCGCVSRRVVFLVVLTLRCLCSGRQFTMSADKVALFDGKAMITASGNVIAPNLGAGNFIG